MIVEEGTNAPIVHADDESITDTHGAVLHQHGRHWPAGLIQLCLDDHPLATSRRIGPQLENFRLQQQHLKQLIDILLTLG